MALLLSGANITRNLGVRVKNLALEVGQRVTVGRFAFRVQSRLLVMATVTRNIDENRQAFMQCLSIVVLIAIVLSVRGRLQDLFSKTEVSFVETRLGPTDLIPSRMITAVLGRGRHSKSSIKLSTLLLRMTWGDPEALIFSLQLQVRRGVDGTLRDIRGVTTVVMAVLSNMV